MRHSTALIAVAVALVCPCTAIASDGGSGTYIVSGQTYDFNLLNTGTTPWQYFALAGPAGTTFVGGATIGEITAHCVAGQPDGSANEIECGPISAAGLAPGTRVGFVASVGAAAACGLPFQLEVSSTGALPFTAAGTVTSTGNCGAPAPTVVKAPALHGPASAGRRLVATAPVWSVAPIQVAYQWQLCTAARCTAIRGATALAIGLGVKEVGHTVRIVATGTFDAGELTATSAKIAVRARAKTRLKSR